MTSLRIRESTARTRSDPRKCWLPSATFIDARQQLVTKRLKSLSLCDICCPLKRRMDQLWPKYGPTIRRLRLDVLVEDYYPAEKLFRSLALTVGSPGATLFNLPSFIQVSNSVTSSKRWSKPFT